MKIFLKLLFIVLLATVSFPAYGAEWTPFQISLVNPIQLLPEEANVHGLRLNLIYGVNKEVNGVDLGTVNRTIWTTRGLQLGAVNITEDLKGVQIGGLFNFATGNVAGMQISGIANSASDLASFSFQISGLINLADNPKGVQLAALYNRADIMKGVQIGLVNVCGQLQGVQIGLANIVEESDYPFVPILNARFNF